LIFFTTAYLLVEWDEGKQHSVIDGKIAELREGSESFKAGAKVTCRLKEGEYAATIVTAGTVAIQI